MWLFGKKNKEKQDLIEKIKNEPLDMDNLFHNLTNRKEVDNLYHELCSLSHPDRFPSDSQKQQNAMELFKDIQAHATDFDYLSKIKNRLLKEQNI